ncbi:hypothetical protein ACIRP3_21940 [Streptomyces sp. NPDC101209]|uniref:hypothetical protein n=1 Tax=Streptomyces sp. NPDC101209 TaxID=3366129 RepID=UPI0037F67DAB
MSIDGAVHKFRFVAEAGEFNADPCDFDLDPVSAESRATPDPRPVGVAGVGG